MAEITWHFNRQSLDSHNKRGPTWKGFRPELRAVSEPLLVRPDDAGGDGSVGADLEAETMGAEGIFE